MAQTSQIGFQPEEIYFADIHKMMQGFVELHLNKKVHVVYDIPKQGSINADRNLLQIILRNLYSNAVKYSYENGTISLSLVTGEHKAEIILSDTGAGMDAEKAEEIRAGRAASTQGTQNESGNGLGLQVVRDFLKMHQTELAVQSKPGKGSAFSFQLPLAAASH
jgi:signal transduction histidine kinase